MMLGARSSRRAASAARRWARRRWPAGARASTTSRTVAVRNAAWPGVPRTRTPDCTASSSPSASACPDSAIAVSRSSRPPETARSSRASCAGCPNRSRVWAPAGQQGRRHRHRVRQRCATGQLVLRQQVVGGNQGVEVPVQGVDDVVWNRGATPQAEARAQHSSRGFAVQRFEPERGQPASCCGSAGSGGQATTTAQGDRPTRSIAVRRVVSDSVSAWWASSTRSRTGPGSTQRIQQCQCLMSLGPGRGRAWWVSRSSLGWPPAASPASSPCPASRGHAAPADLAAPPSDAPRRATRSCPSPGRRRGRAALRHPLQADTTRASSRPSSPDRPTSTLEHAPAGVLRELSRPPRCHGSRGTPVIPRIRRAGPGSTVES